jgi:hypothetical protein
MKLVEFDGRDFDGREVFASVMSGNIGVLHGVIPELDASRAVDAALSWAKIEPVFDTKGGTVSPKPLQNFNRVDNNPALSKTKHIFHTFNLENVTAIGGVEGAAITRVFEKLVQVDNALMGKRGSLSPAEDGGVNFRPQIIHYPKGGGFFDRHTHPLEPQKIGLIASLTKKGDHFDRGGTLFWEGNVEFDAGPAQSIGSVTLFRFDLPHAVSECDPGAPMEFGKHSGRWPAVLPYR